MGVMKNLSKTWDNATNLLSRLMFGKPKSSRKKILRKNATTYTPPVQTPPPVEVTEKISEPVEIAVEEKVSTPVDVEIVENIPEPPQKNYSEDIINIKDSDDWKKLSDKLNNLRGFEEFLQENNLQWVKIRLERVRDVLQKLTPPEDFSSDELNFNVAKKVREISEIMLDIFQNADSSTQLDENLRGNLKNLVEDYLKNIGVEQENFQSGDSYDDWASLGMGNSSYHIISTDNQDLHGKIAEIEIQPHVIHYVGETGDVEKFIFGGICQAYIFKED